jgi:23S rRNA (pseudouridine1915-N3)-methyltransferase
MARLKVIAVTENKEKWVQAATQTYQEKLVHFAKCEIIAVKPYKSPRGDNQEKIKKESEIILKKIDGRDHVILCDERGKSYSSVDFSKRLQKSIEGAGSGAIVFIIGGAYGVGEEVRQRANEKLKLSDMVMNHYVAHTVLLEQIYRAFTILKGIPYHNT